LRQDYFKRKERSVARQLSAAELSRAASRKSR
jgi:hypothetical protein